MYVATSSLPHLLAPECYSARGWFDREWQRLLRPSWHLAATRRQLSRPGDFVTCDILGEPVHVRNSAGTLRAFSNVCVHRHCLLTSRRGGNAAALSCQYHGWEYGDDGRTRRIPAPKNFIPFDRDQHRLATFRVESCGQLVFVSLSPTGPTLRDQLGDFFDLCASRFHDGWREFLCWEPPADVNWKIPIENSLEAYHVPTIHPDTFREDPGPERSVHTILSNRTSLETLLPFSAHSRLDRWFQSGESWFLRRLGFTTTARYSQHHIFPNLLFSFTDAISLVQCVVPHGPRSSRSVVRQFGRVGAAMHGPRRWLAMAWGHLAAAIAKRVLREDLALYSAIQRGLDSSTQRGVLGACEDRIHAFQAHVVKQCGSIEELMSPRSADHD